MFLNICSGVCKGAISRKRCTYLRSMFPTPQPPSCENVMLTGYRNNVLEAHLQFEQCVFVLDEASELKNQRTFPLTAFARLTHISATPRDLLSLRNIPSNFCRLA